MQMFSLSHDLEVEEQAMNMVTLHAEANNFISIAIKL